MNYEKLVPKNNIGTFVEKPGIGSMGRTSTPFGWDSPEAQYLQAKIPDRGLYVQNDAEKYLHNSPLPPPQTL